MTQHLQPTPLNQLVAGHDRPAHETLAMAWLAGFRSPRTRAAYSLGIRSWFGWCEECNADPLGIARAHIDLWVRQLEARLADRTVALRITTLASFYEYLVDQDVIAKNPTKGVRRPKVQRKSPTAWLRRPQLADLIAGAAELGPHPHALVTLLALNGLRISEACGIDVDALRYRDFYPQLTVTRKGDLDQVITLARPTEAVILAAIADRTDGPLLLTGYLTRMNQKAAQRILDKAAVNVRGEHGRITPHVLRHSWTTIALQAGVNPDQIMHDGGWQDHRMVGYYAHGQDDPIRAATHAVAGLVLSS